MISKKDKRGIEAEVLIGIIVIIISFVIIVLFFTFFQHKEFLDKEACRDSVVLRSLPIIGQGQSFAPLNCKTQQIVIENKKYKTDEEIKARIANEMYDCWWMMGEGKLTPFKSLKDEVVSGEGWGFKRISSACAICSVVSFDETLKSKNSQLDIEDYLFNTNVPTKTITYMQYFTQDQDINTKVGAEPITTNTDYAVIYFDIESHELWEPIVKDVGLIAGGLVSVPGSLKAAGSILRLTSKVPYLNLIVGVLAAGTAVYQTVQVGRGQALAAGYCDGAKEGCQQVMIVPYDAKVISESCGKLETIP